MPITTATRVGALRQRVARRKRIAQMARGPKTTAQQGGAEATPARFLSVDTDVSDFAYVEDDTGDVLDQAQRHLVYADRLTRRSAPFALELAELHQAIEHRREHEKPRQRAASERWAGEVLGLVPPPIPREVPLVNGKRAELYAELLAARQRVAELERRLKT